MRVRPRAGGGDTLDRYRPPARAAKKAALRCRNAAVSAANRMARRSAPLVKGLLSRFCLRHFCPTSSASRAVRSSPPGTPPGGSHDDRERSRNVLKMHGNPSNLPSVTAELAFLAQLEGMPTVYF